MNKAQRKLGERLRAWRDQKGIDPDTHRRLRDLINLHNKGVYISEQDLKFGHLWGIRNSAYRGDEIGWLDDDLDLEYDDDDSEDDCKPAIV